MHPNTQTTKNLKIKKSLYFEVLLIKDIEEKKNSHKREDS